MNQKAQLRFDVNDSGSEIPASPPKSDQVQSPENILKLTHVPCNLLGKILDQGRGSAYAAHLLAIKCSKGPTFVLNEHHVAREYGMSRRAFQTGIRVLKKCEAIERTQTGRRSYAAEKLADASRNFVLISEKLLRAKSGVLAFVIAVNLSSHPLRPAEAAQRIGVTARGTIRKMVKAAIADASVSHQAMTRGAILLARRGYNFDLVKNDPAKNVPAKNDPAHREWNKDTGSVPNTQKSGSPASYGTRPEGLGCMDKSFEGSKGGKVNLEPQWMVLKHWTASEFWTTRGYFAFSGKQKDHSLDRWKQQLDYYGGAPGHISTPSAHQQAIEIAHELIELCGSADFYRAMQALAFWICRAHAAGKVIRSLAFIAEELARQAENGDETWLYDFPTRLPEAEFAAAAKLARQAVDALEGNAGNRGAGNDDAPALAQRCCSGHQPCDQQQHQARRGQDDLGLVLV